MAQFPLDPFFTTLAADGICLTSRDYKRIILARQTADSWTCVPTRAIYVHHDEGVCEMSRDLRRKQVHYRGIRPGQNQRGHAAQGRRNRRIPRQRFAHRRAGTVGRVPRNAHAGWVLEDVAKPGCILHHGSGGYH